MRLWLTYSQAKAIADHARRTAPDEACGLLGCYGEQVTAIVPVENIASNPTTAYHLDPATQVETLLAFQRTGKTLAAIYHSHPTTDPIPSPTDVQQAAYPGVAHLIVSLKWGEARLAAWEINARSVTPIELIISDTPPAPAAPGIPNTPTTRAAIILSLLLGATLLIAVSLLLLPPAPPIP